MLIYRYINDTNIYKKIPNALYYIYTHTHTYIYIYMDNARIYISTDICDLHNLTLDPNGIGDQRSFNHQMDHFWILKHEKSRM